MTKTDHDDDLQLLSFTEAGRELGQSPWAVRRKVERGELPVVDIGTPARHKYRIRRSALRSYIESRENDALRRRIIAESERQSADPEAARRLAGIVFDAQLRQERERQAAERQDGDGCGEMLS
jgi:helix-turn-helix protein